MQCKINEICNNYTDWPIETLLNQVSITILTMSGSQHFVTETRKI